MQTKKFQRTFLISDKHFIEDFSAVINELTLFFLTPERNCDNEHFQSW